jgi:hypothetical protein
LPYGLESKLSTPIVLERVGRRQARSSGSS